MRRNTTSAAAHDHQGNDPSSRTAPLRIIRMPASKPWRRPERAPPQVYHVDCGGFRQLVQRLTGASPPSCPPRVPATPQTTNAVASAADPPITVGGASGTAPPALGGGGNDSIVESSSKQSNDGFGGLIWQADWDYLSTCTSKHGGLDFQNCN